MELKNTWIDAFENENKTVRTICMEHQAKALAVLQALTDSDAVNLLPRDQVKPLLTELAGREPMTIIVEKEGCIFEMKCAFPNGAESHGYYNFSFAGPTGLAGHMDIRHIAHVATTSEIFFNKSSKSWWFIHENGHVIFKVYVGRDAQGNFLPTQLALFEAWAAKK